LNGRLEGRQALLDLARLVELGPNEDGEEQGARPAIVFSGPSRSNTAISTTRTSLSGERTPVSS